MQQIRCVLKFRVEDIVMMAADVVGDMPMQDVGEDERRWAIAYLCNQYLGRMRGAGAYR